MHFTLLFLIIVQSFLNREMRNKIEKVIEGFPLATIHEDQTYYYIDLRTGLGESYYPKLVFSLDEAIDLELNWMLHN